MQKGRIIAEARQLFMTLGIRSVSMDDVCRALGISKKTLYEHVDNKHDLVKLAVEEHYQDECRIIDNIIAESNDALETMINIGRHIIDLVKKLDPGVVHDMKKYYPQVYSDWEIKENKYIHESLVKNLNLGIQQGYYRPEIDVEIIARFYAGKVQIITNEKIFPPHLFSQEEIVRQHFIYHLHGIMTQVGIEKMYGDILSKLKDKS